MSLRKIDFLVFVLSLCFVSCNNDDDVVEIAEVVVRDRGEQQIEDNAALLEYFSTHYYNAGDFVGVANPKIANLLISELPEDGVLPDPDTNRLLSAELVSDNPNGILKDTLVNLANTNYKIYYLQLNKGGGEKFPNFSDRIRYIYDGKLLDGTTFDSAVTPVTSNLVSNGIDADGLIVGFRKVIPQFKVAASFNENNDGTFNYTNHGTGVMFLPSGMAYFNNARPGIPAYSPILFKFEIYESFDNDYDADGVPSHLEDLNGDGEFFVDPDDPDNDDDTDGNGVPDFVDPDDDGDGILTINEDLDNDGDPTNDIGPNGIPRYLDPEATESKE